MRVLVIGTGFGRQAMAPVYRGLGFDVEVVSPRDESALHRALNAGVDLVSVHSPPFLHRQHVTAAVDRGYPVLCDKPFGRNADEARAMRDHAARRAVPTFLNFELRHQPARAEFKKLADSGVIGTPRHLSWTFFGAGLRGRPHGWINERDTGGGWIGANGAHLIDYTRYLFGSEITGCGGVARIEDPHRPDPQGRPRRATAEDAYSAWFVTENGCTATHDTAFAAAVALPPRMVLTGSAGALELIGDSRLIVHRADADPMTHEFPPAPPRSFYEPALTPWLEQVADALRTGRPATPSFDDGVAVAEVMDRLRANVIEQVMQ
ncbi:Gfo/Idh/MocA family protein [Mycolicibacterium thermoresistibile]|uniref:Oxidoreductase domain-containing protein n=2 Tax=Mycolicibacterium thermoresistibile TaxID=1797 RepID=G7CJJ0_MYCT3|nr:Gfo/Idh/MocA family oxidoreductase [Mycolicibacterium thermoresistibile]EHI11510.1 oxidoreductase domain-containing protein [Mycolicibacterium thermoresistibile ATCC 19527]MCV7189062.1 Gfo/Idh/MocA family oxidoreductase [Mycolicibacterium thermoresistibile]GAT14750.1 oxidoreductase domain-containing protein [Mycolicibacterium thermoresistibile]SNW19976.1 oxidoreductase domain-containing protein [Mycolicibacterium thermoresistibile]